MSDTLLDELIDSQRQVAAWIRRRARGESQIHVGAWSVRDVAAHLSVTEVECLEPRIHSIAGGGNPHFHFYNNDNRDFSGTNLDDALADWARTRARVLDFVEGLTEAQLRLTGTHDTFGELTVSRYLEIALEHDRDHLRALEEAAGAAR